MNKLNLKKIAKRYCKSILINLQSTDSFFDHLSPEECSYLKEEITKIADKITPDNESECISSLINDYKK